MIRTTVSLPDKFYEELCQQAMVSGYKRSQFIRHLLELGLVTRSRRWKECQEHIDESKDNK